MSAAAAIQRAMYTRLDNDGPLAAAGFKVFDEAPDLSYDGSYIVLGDSTEARGPGSHSGRVWEGTETLHLWYRGASSVAAKDALELVRSALESSPLNVAGHSTMLVRYEFSTTLKEPGWRHLVIRFRVVTGSGLPPGYST
ncbi:MAG: DUF3168 domain-containing protein [Gammaproteobacteria bacterium]|nr:MAG: DUF3168 domain-containing protein [Gammaproteobacteria bacterium]